MVYKTPLVGEVNNIWPLAYTIRGNSSNYNVSKITKLQRRVCKVTLEAEYTDARSRLNILSFDQAVLLNKAKIMYKIVNVIAPQYIRDLFQLRADTLTFITIRFK